MAEIHEPRVLELPDNPEAPTAKRRRKVRVTDVIFFAIIAVVIISLSVFIANRLKLKHEVSDAKVVANQVIADLAKQDTAGIRSLGDKQFQAKNSAASLNAHLTATDVNGTKITFAQLYGGTTPTIVQQIVANNSRGQHVTLIYEYNALKAPFFVRVDTAKAPGSDKWTLQAFSASANEANLLGQ